MKDYAPVCKSEKYVEVCFYIEHETVMAVGEKMNGLCEEAYMNGYNWEAFLQHYLNQTEPALLENMATDPEAGMYVAYYPNTPENEVKAEHLSAVIHALVEDEAELFRFLEREKDAIQWD